MKFDILYNEVDSKLLLERISQTYDDEMRAFVSHSLDYKNICFKLEGINKLQLMLIKSMEAYGLNVADRNDLRNTNPEFCKLQTDNEDIQAYYHTLIKNTKGLCKMLQEENFDVELSYILPLSTLCDVYVDMSVRNFLRFIQTCIKYKELYAIFECIQDAKIVDDLLHLSYEYSPNLETGFDLYLNELVDPIPRGDVTDKELNNPPVVFETPLDKIAEVAKATGDVVAGKMTLNSVMTCSYACYDGLLNLGHSKRIKIENPLQVMNSPECYDINVTLPQSILQSKHVDLVYDILNGWVKLINLINNIDVDVFADALLAQVGAMMIVYKHTTTIEDDWKFMQEDHKYNEELLAIRSGRLYALCNSSLVESYNWINDYDDMINGAYDMDFI